MKALYLEDALELTSHYVRPDSDWCVHSRAARKRREAAAAASAAASSGRAGGSSDANGGGGADGGDVDDARSDYERRFPAAVPTVIGALASLDLDCLNVDLVVEVVLWYLSGASSRLGYAESDGAVLVFLSGVQVRST